MESITTRDDSERGKPESKYISTRLRQSLVKPILVQQDHGAMTYNFGGVLYSLEQKPDRFVEALTGTSAYRCTASKLWAWRKKAISVLHDQNRDAYQRSKYQGLVQGILKSVLSASSGSAVP